MTNIKFLKSNVLEDATYWNVPASAFANTIHTLKGGKKENIWQSSASNSSMVFEWTRDVDSSADTILISNLKKSALGIYDDYIDVKLESGSGSYGTVFNDTTVSFTGYNEVDYFNTFTLETETDFKLTLTYNDNLAAPYSTHHVLQGIILGKGLDLGRDPSDFSYKLKEKQKQTFTSYTGAAYPENFVVPNQIYSFEYTALTDAQLESFFDLLNVYDNKYLCAYASTNDKIFNEKTFAYGEISRITFSKRKNNYNNLSFDLTEL